ncbi:DivIVA domain-containing protein [Streptomonospora alba]|uniref:DivIVA domain-containing protein n=1 Tax=Streptomonospora alba TaxID=183763 RepID=UPI000ADFD046|nr:DivIVA domain-containing protein [Streptomonospora alba]
MTAREDTGSTNGSHRRLSPERVRAQEFSRTPIGRRGFSEEEVRRFMGRVAEDIAASDAEKASLRAEIDRLRRRYREQNASPADAEGPPADAVNLLSAAQQQADAYVAQAQDYCRQLTEQARQQAEDILVEARDQAGAAAEEAARGYRKSAGPSYDADLEEMERRVAWIQTFCRAVQVQMQAASDAFSQEIARLSEYTADAAARNGLSTEGTQGTQGTQGARHAQQPQQPPPQQRGAPGGIGPDADDFYQHQQRHAAPEADRRAAYAEGAPTAWPQRG